MTTSEPQFFCFQFLKCFCSLNVCETCRFRTILFVSVKVFCCFCSSGQTLLSFYLCKNIEAMTLKLEIVVGFSLCRYSAKRGLNLIKVKPKTLLNDLTFKNYDLNVILIPFNLSYNGSEKKLANVLDKNCWLLGTTLFIICRIHVQNASQNDEQAYDKCFLLYLNRNTSVFSLTTFFTYNLLRVCRPWLFLTILMFFCFRLWLWS